MPHETSHFGIVAAPLLGCCGAALAEDGEPYAGRWDCGEEVLIGSSMYNDGGEPLDIVGTQEGSDSCYTLLFANGAFTTLSDITDNQLTWFSDASGTTLECARLFGE